MSNVSNPLFAPALLTAEVQAGAWMRTGEPLRVDKELTLSGALQHFVGYMFVGAPVVGLVLAICGAAITFGTVALLPTLEARKPYRLPNNASAWMKAIERAASRFASPDSPLPAERTRFHYLRAKLLMDPMARLLADIAESEPNEFGAILDLGSGRGQLPLLIMELGRARSVHGIDWDERKVAVAQRAAAAERDGMEHLHATFTQGDIRTVSLEPAETVLLIDVLHYFALDEQDAILDRAAAAVCPGGRLLLREADTQRGWRSFVTLAEERFFTSIHFNRGERVRFRPVADIAARLESRGLRCELRPAWGKTPFSNVVVIGRRASTP
jgi:2-polyprenyl-3-methyl-5-hydroxy-6-metoxy-1,4-benzoquinol methylase